MMIIIRKKVLIVMAVLLIMSIGIINNRHNLMMYAFNMTNRSVVLIDPGHGGIDGGAVSRNGIEESHINLEIAFKLKALFEENGWKVIMTREEDIGLYSDEGTIRSKKMQDLLNRKKIIDKERPDYVISIHLNSFPDASCFGAQTFYPGKSPESKLLAEQIQDAIKNNIDNGNRREAKEKNDIILLKKIVAPTVLVECGFLTNAKEEQLLQEDEYQSTLAQCIYDGLLKYCQITNNPPKKSIKYVVNE